MVLPTTLALTPIAPADRVTADEANGRSTTLSDPSVASAPKDGDGGWRPSRRHPLLLIWAVSTCLLFCLYAAWSFVQPIGATYDESAQLDKGSIRCAGRVCRPGVFSQAGHPPDSLRTELILNTAISCQALSVVTKPSPW